MLVRKEGGKRRKRLRLRLWPRCKETLGGHERKNTFPRQISAGAEAANLLLLMSVPSFPRRPSISWLDFGGAGSKGEAFLTAEIVTS